MSTPSPSQPPAGPSLPPPLPPLPPPLPPRSQRYVSDLKLGWIKQVIFLMGLPVEARQTLRESRLLALPALVIAITVLSFWHWLTPEVAIWWQGFVYWPGQQGLAWWSSLVGYAFLHSDLLHLGSNLYFILVFGDNIESRFGKRRFVVLFFAAVVMGALFHGTFSSSGLIGASGGALGLVVFYCIMFPHARVLWLPFGLLGRLTFWVFARNLIHRGFSIWWYLALSLSIDLLLLHEQLFAQGNISALAHLGGASIGALIAWGWRRGWLP